MAVLNFAANLVLIPRFGAVGAAFAAVLAFALGAALSARAGRNIGVHPRLARAFAGGIACAAVAALPLLVVDDFNGNPARAALTAGGMLLLYLGCVWSVDVCGFRRWLHARLRPLLNSD